MKTLALLIVLILMVGCQPEQDYVTLEEFREFQVEIDHTSTIDELLVESDLIRSIKFQIKLQDSIIAQLMEAVHGQVLVSQGFDKLNQQQQKINEQVFLSIKLLSAR